MLHVGRSRYSQFVARCLLVFTWGLVGTVHAHSAQSAAPAMSSSSSVSIPGPQALAAQWEQVHSKALPVAPLVRHPDVEQHLKALQARAPDLFQLEVAGHSVEGRALYHVTLGTGPRHILLWSQMHGDEPTATTALLDFFEYLRTHRQEPWVARLLSSLTLHAVPMLNPDGAERFQRRNAQGIDINRDALALQTPEARTLKSLRDKFQPSVGFNLHNQSWRHAVGDTGRPASISLLAPAFDRARSDNPGRILAKKVCAVIRDAVETLAPGQVGRYDDSFEVRAFGDNMTLWGTPTVLIETGAWLSLPPDEPLVRLNFVALATALDALANGQAEKADVSRYDSIPENESSGLVHLLLKGVGMFGADGKPFTGDVGIAVSRAVRGQGKKLLLAHVGKVEELGDLRILGAVETVDGKGLFVVPLTGKGAKPGDTYRLTRPAKQSLSLGQRADLMLLKPLEASDTFRIERIIRFDP
ncbi:peptidase M14 [Myxococcus llanfairpwllgwyngyllgogerychwyrndrobwllllantysiliogogogochensis]|uniref:Peptidase M14 n=1 Tax=Myxococcus llanfairpwllgwyngyllgogerychwyrndrobwllllantysiliogogogochensis TaxID=2590453 RepID=A0A540WMJ0_9BACT|nr:M14 metallopeptidase family protein [Myxococcus llanfairpwllgwyngyllgogerychwyrndrobwllllantysiliogogogochensis]TQF10250.1 peptidase M14 [Myxococcus llanfairpwllgwyngyllgogerychwyrndrobwllllantysiliogogogochensis]